MTTPYILLATQRTGSSWVQEMLGSHPAILGYTDIFLIDAYGFRMWEPSDVEFANTFLDSRRRRPVSLTRRYWGVRYLQKLFDHPAAGAVGFKYMYDQVRHSPEVLAYAAARRVKVVH